MTLQETAEILKRLSVHYPAFVATADVVGEWYRDFAGTDYETVKAAVTLFLQKNVKGYLPSVARIREHMVKSTAKKAFATRYWTIALDENGMPYIRKINYFVRTTKSGLKEWIEDEDGYIFSDPDDNDVLINRVRSTGSVMIEAEAKTEYEMLEKRLERNR